ncbi:MAG TPA: hypothetical protein VGR02_07775 [Thermoanaerobaculia bacterium]|nr:hypothetical protein [Thermoanaerobaculia bacterium]
MFRLSISAGAALLAACASSTPPLIAGDGLFEQLCALADASVIHISAVTSPRYDFVALLTASSGDEKISPEMLDAAYRLQERESAEHRPLAVMPPVNSRCSWEQVRPSSGADGTLIEISSPVSDPYSKQRGVFVRVSDSGRSGARWYWLPLSEDGRTSGPAMALPVHDG